MACYLKELDLTMTEDEYEMFQDIPAKESGSTNEAYGIPYDKFKNYLKKEINDTSLNDIILSLEMLDVVCDMKIDALRKIKDDTLKQDDITSSDSKNLYIDKEGGTVSIPKVSYLFLMGREAIKYAPVKAAKESMKGARKILKKVNNKNNKKIKSN